MNDYHKPESCNKCKGLNDFIDPNYCDHYGLLCETKTKCSECGFEDFWAYGYFKSIMTMECNCETYSFDN